MNDANNILQLNGPHLKKCACGCGTEFYGRRNQKYIAVSHKSFVNNENRNKELERFTPLFDEVRNTFKALEKGLTNVDKDGWIYTGELIKYGFNPDCLAKTGTNKSGIQYKYILGLAFRLSENKQHVQIIKMKQNGNNTN